jgi:DNA-directed RNA polymerase subunit K/omega
MAGRADIARENGKKGGRPKGSKSKGTLEKERVRELVRQAITAKIVPLIDAQVANALGLKYLVVRDKRTGKFLRVTRAIARSRQHKLEANEELIEVWEKDPCVQAFTDLLNRAIDKPKEQPVDAAIAGEVIMKWQS